MVQFFFGILRTMSEPKVKKRASKNKTNDSQHGLNKVFMIITILPTSGQYIGKCELSRQS